LALVRRIREQFAIPNSLQFAENLPAAGKTKSTAFNWSVGVWLSALVSAAQADATLIPFVQKYAIATRAYWNPLPPVAGYDVLPGPKDVDRYYDDNEWMVMALADLARLTKDESIWQDAERAMTYALSGLDSKLGGGIYWRESDRIATKNTCSNAPAVAALISLYRHDHRPERLKQAAEIYDWTYSKLRDPADDLMWDAIRADGSVEKTKWSYNTALMIRSAAELHELTNRPIYQTQLRRFMRSSIRHWFEPGSGKMKDEGKFAHLLLESWQIAAKIDDELAGEVAPVVEKVRARLRTSANADGWYGPRWDTDPKLIAEPALIDQASVARALLFRMN
jgi:uncharacterized protein YyaL (SSP411 family)